MRSSDYWQMFLETGAPELYLLYQNSKRMERSDVSEDSGAGPAGNSLQ